MCIFFVRVDREPTHRPHAACRVENAPRIIPQARRQALQVQLHMVEVRGGWHQDQGRQGVWRGVQKALGRGMG